MDEKFVCSEGKAVELVTAIHIIAFEGYYYTLDKSDGELNALFRTIIHLASKAIHKEEINEGNQSPNTTT